METVTVIAKLKIIDDVKLEPTLKEAQAFVGGYVEMVRLDDGILLVDEEGKLKRLPTNHLASAMYEKTYGGDADIINGNAIYIPNTLTESQWFS